MSKKINATSVATIPATETKLPDTQNYPKVTPQELEAKLTEFSNVSLRKLAPEVKVSYGVLLRKSREATPGEIYNPEETNWTALAETINSVLERRRGFAQIDWDALNSGPARQGAQLIKDMEKFTVGTKVYLRRNNDTPYEIVYKTETHIVLQLEGTQEPIAWANNTFLINGPVFEPRAVRVTTKVEEEGV